MNRVMLYRHHAYETDMCAVCHVVMCAEILDILTCGVDIFLLAPCVRSLRSTYLYRIAEEVSLLDAEAQAVDAVAAVAAGEMIDILALGVQRVAGYLYAALVMDPYVRSVRAGDIMGVSVEIAREHVQSQYDNTVASVAYPYQCVTVFSGLGYEPRHMGSGQTELYRVAVAEV